MQLRFKRVFQVTVAVECMARETPERRGTQTGDQETRQLRPFHTCGFGVCNSHSVYTNDHVRQSNTIENYSCSPY